MGLGYWSLRAYVKKNVKNAVSFIGAFEKAIVQYARRDHVDGVVCGHIHSPVIRDIDGTAYYNTGDWVESLSALTEDFTGKIELVTHFVWPIAEPSEPNTDLDLETSETAGGMYHSLRRFPRAVEDVTRGEISGARTRRAGSFCFH